MDGLRKCQSKPTVKGEGQGAKHENVSTRRHIFVLGSKEGTPRPKMRLGGGIFGLGLKGRHGEQMRSPPNVEMSLGARFDVRGVWRRWEGTKAHPYGHAFAAGITGRAGGW